MNKMPWLTLIPVLMVTAFAIERVRAEPDKDNPDMLDILAAQWEQDTVDLRHELERATRDVITVEQKRINALEKLQGTDRMRQVDVLEAEIRAKRVYVEALKDVLRIPNELGGKICWMTASTVDEAKQVGEVQVCPSQF